MTKPQFMNYLDYVAKSARSTATGSRTFERVWVDRHTPKAGMVFWDGSEPVYSRLDRREATGWDAIEKFELRAGQSFSEEMGLELLLESDD